MITVIVKSLIDRNQFYDKTKTIIWCELYFVIVQIDWTISPAAWRITVLTPQVGQPLFFFCNSSSAGCLYKKVSLWTKYFCCVLQFQLRIRQRVIFAWKKIFCIFEYFLLKMVLWICLFPWFVWWMLMMATSCNCLIELLIFQGRLLDGPGLSTYIDLFFFY